jgi:hypothetical protein
VTFDLIEATGVMGSTAEAGDSRRGMSGMATDTDTGASHDDEVHEEITRYRRAAQQTLDQLEWCVDYLYRIGKPRIARAIQQNRSSISRRMSPSED